MRDVAAPPHARERQRGMAAARVQRGPAVSDSLHWCLRWSWLLVGLGAVLIYAHELLDIRRGGIPLGLDAGTELSYEVPLRPWLSGIDNLSWFFVAFDGMPLLGHPIGHLFYLPYAIPVVLYGGVGLRVAYVFSLALAWACMWVLARTLGARPWIASWAGVLFAISGVIGARIYAGHVAKVLSTPLVPLVLACMLVAGRQRTPRQAAGWSACAGAIQGLMVLAGEPYLPVYLGLALLLVMGLAARGPGWRWRVPSMLLGWAGAALVVASAKLAGALDLLAQSARVVETFDGSQDWYWGFVHLVDPWFLFGPTLPGQALPDVSYLGTRPGPGTQDYGWWEFSNYVGILPVLLAALALAGLLAMRLRRRGTPLGPGLRGRELLGVVAFGVVGLLWLADGTWYSPVHWLYAAIPLLNQFRIPSRALALTAVAVLALAAVGMELALRRTSRASLQARRACTLVLVGCGLLAVADVYSVTHWIPNITEPAHVAQASHAADVLLARDPGPFVVGIGDFQDEWSHVMYEFTRRGIRVAYPLAPLTPSMQLNRSLVTADKQVRYMLVRKVEPGTLPGHWAPLFEDGDLQMLVNTDAAGDAWFLGDTGLAPLAARMQAPTSLVIQVDASRPGRVLAPANAFPGWSVAVDGGPPAPTLETDGLVSSEAALGPHTYTFTYQPPRGGLILALAGVGWIVLAALAGWAARQRPPVAGLPAA